MAKTPEQIADELLAKAGYAAPGKKARAKAKPNGHAAEQSQIHIEDFVAYMPMHNYIFTPTGETWPASSVNARIPPVREGDDKTIPASKWLDKNAPVEHMTWCPGEPMLIKDRLISEGGWIERRGCTVFNLYRPPTLVLGHASEPTPWLNHVRRIYPNEAEHILRWLAHRLQQPREKINHALVLGGKQGIGKDTLLEPIKQAVGPWNFVEVTPRHVLGRFNGFVKSVILRVNEARDLGDFDRFALYDHMKIFTASPPDVLRVDEKNLREYSVFNVCGVVITSNHKSDGIYLSPDDRRHFVAWSALAKEDFEDGYWTGLYHYYDHGGNEAVAGYLANLDLTDFDPKAPPPTTQAFWEIVNANRAPENADLADAIDQLGRPDALTLGDLVAQATPDFAEWLRNRQNTRRIPHRLEECGYVAVRNEDAKDELWRVNGKRQVIYAKEELPLNKRIAAASERTSR